MAAFQVTIEVRNVESQQVAEEWAAATISLAHGPRCPCTHGGKHEAWGNCPSCKGSGNGPHPCSPRVISARSNR